MRSGIGLLLSAVLFTFAVSGCGESSSKSTSSSVGALPKDAPTKMSVPPPPPLPKN